MTPEIPRPHYNTLDDTGGTSDSEKKKKPLSPEEIEENRKKPLSDSKIAELIAEQGIKVARRTVAKYREALGIAPSNERKVIRS